LLQKEQIKEKTETCWLKACTKAPWKLVYSCRLNSLVVDSQDEVQVTKFVVGHKERQHKMLLFSFSKPIL